MLHGLGKLILMSYQIFLLRYVLRDQIHKIRISPEAMILINIIAYKPYQHDVLQNKMDCVAIIDRDRQN